MAVAPLVGWYELEIYCDRERESGRTFVVIGEVLPPGRPADDIKMAMVDITRSEIFDLVGGEVSNLEYDGMKVLPSPVRRLLKPIEAPAVEWLRVWGIIEK
ncbi:MAG TPA: hypothetical protein VNY07_09825 [Chthoniobacterales bacterium]|jgi:hypothetical protein|nr:hypothetical protein [Chthoniobacterales bacterium]